MVCIYCKNNTFVTNSRTKDNNQTWRRRKCLVCNASFTSIEEIIYDKYILIASDKKLYKFTKEQLFLDIYSCIGHLKNRDGVSIAKYISDIVIKNINKNINKGLIDLVTYQEIIFKTLKRFNNVAGIHYKAYFIDQKNG
jgi:transcriptional regulator NrdR family protein